MGGCVSHRRHSHSHRRRRRRSHSSRHGTTASGTVGRNKPLNRAACHPRWKSDVAITENQLRRKREEYWDTDNDPFTDPCENPDRVDPLQVKCQAVLEANALHKAFKRLHRREILILAFSHTSTILAPAFDGRKEIWDALRGACYAIEQNDIDLAQSIINCANISLPHGTLLDCYDELGTRYQLPVYVLSPPINMIDGEQSSIDSHGDFESGTSDIGLAITAADREHDFGGNHSSSSSTSSSNIHSRPASTTKASSSHRAGHNPIVREIKKHRRKQKSNTHADSGHDSSSTNTTTPPANINQQPVNIEQDAAVAIKFRLSNNKEHRLYCKPNDKIRHIKRRLALLENGALDSQNQRLFFGGKLLRDRSTVRDARLQRNFVVQVILTDKPVSLNNAITTNDQLPTTVGDIQPSNSTAIELPTLTCSN